MLAKKMIQHIMFDKVVLPKYIFLALAMSIHNIDDNYFFFLVDFSAFFLAAALFLAITLFMAAPLLAGAFFLAGALALGAILYEFAWLWCFAMTPVSTPRFSALRRKWRLKFTLLYFAMMNFSIAMAETPVRSFVVLIASTAMEM